MNNEKRKILQERLATYERAWRAGKRLAIVDALNDCHRFKVPPPLPLIHAVRKLIEELAPSDRRDQIHYMRWDAVKELRDRKDDLARSGYKPTWEAAFENAAELLRGTIAEGEADTMKRSYQLVNKAMKGRKAARFFVSSFDETKPRS